MCSGYPLVSSKLAKILGFKGYLPLPLSPTPRSKRELGQPLLSRECANGASQFSVLPLPLSFAHSRESKGCPNSRFDRGVGLTPVSHCKLKWRVSGAEAVRMQSRCSASPLCFHTLQRLSRAAEPR